MDAAEKGVRGATQPDAGRRRSVDEFSRLGEVDAERLFRVDMLVRGDRSQPDLDVRLGNRQVQYDLDRGIGKNRLHGSSGLPVLCPARLRGGAVQVGDRDDIEHGELFRGGKVRAADRAASDHAHCDRLHIASPIGCAGASRNGAGPVVPHGAP